MSEQECKFDNCESRKYSRGWCANHYQRWYRTGDPAGVGRRGAVRIEKDCIVEGCGLPYAAKDRCFKHYTQWKNSLSPKDLGYEGCSRGCDRAVYAKGYCRNCYARLTLKGDPRTRAEIREAEPIYCLHHPDRLAHNISKSLCQSCYNRAWRGEEGPAKQWRRTGYWLAHKRLYRLRGKADTHACAAMNCQEQAKDWALRHDAVAREIETYGSQTGSAYSLVQDDYVPLCRRHHLHYDRGWAEAPVFN